MFKIKPLTIIFLLLLFIVPLCQELYKQKIYNRAMRAFCVQSHLGRSVNEISAIVAQNKMLKIPNFLNKGNQPISEIIVFPKKPSFDSAICQLEIKNNKVINIGYAPAEAENKVL